ncbi:methyl-accepting chemotaxis protein [Mongoliimonas terrestris]|uniref:methyl-accepting chemotaxis protein n=1 Tax=Mongoliimonas terrestris TaxID=1709001 RepID=UPI0015880B39|nr:methyl-accepting chemotaxis protein [Mongoliimonas terrestris]
MEQYRVASERAFKGERLNRLVTAAVMESRGIYAAADQEAAKPFAAGLRKVLGNIDAHLADWQSKISADEKAVFEPVLAKSKEFIAFRTEVARLAEEESPQAANALGNNEANRTNRKQFQASIDALVETDQGALDAVVSSLEAFHTQRAQLILVIAGVGIVLGAGIATFIGLRTIVRPLRAVTTVLERVSEGDYSAKVAETAGRDEIGRLWRTISRLTTALKAAEDTRAAQRQRDADMVAERLAETEALTNRFRSEVGGLIDEVASASRTLIGAAEVLAGDAAATSERSASVARASNETSGSVQAVASASQELSASIAEIGRQISDASQLINQAVGEAHATDEEVKALADGTSRIGVIVAMIQAIAEQTNLLALNATIEAARAGDAGRGFAVVASEVKALANQTAKATQDIEAQMGAIQSSTARTVSRIADISGRISTLDTITGAVAAAAEQQNAATGEIASRITEAANGAGHVAAVIEDVQKTAVKSGTASREVLAAATRLGTQANELQSKLDRFLSSMKAA